MTEIINFTPLDDTAYPMECIVDAVQDQSVYLDSFEFDETLFDSIPNYHQSSFDVKNIFRKMDQIDHEVKEKDFQNILEDIKPDLFATVTKKKRNPKKVTNPDLTKSPKKSKPAKPARKKNKLAKKDSPPQEMIEEDDFQVEKIMAHFGDWDDLENMQFKIRWLGYNENEDTWEPFAHLENCIKKLEEYCEWN